MKKNLKFLYGIIAIFVLVISTIGATYAYWVASTQSESGAINTESTIYSISMNIDSLFSGFSVIPMNDADALKALKNKCRDKYNRGACSAYTIFVHEYHESLNFISGIMDVTTNNMSNLSYMMLRLSDTYDEDTCVEVEVSNGVFENYCIGKEATPVGDGLGLSLGNSYSVVGMDSTKFILLIWLSNLRESQNEIDIGTFEAIVTMQAGNGGKITGSISSVIDLDNGATKPEDDKPKDEITNEENTDIDNSGSNDDMVGDDA